MVDGLVSFPLSPFGVDLSLATSPNLAHTPITSAVLSLINELFLLQLLLHDLQVKKEPKRGRNNSGYQSHEFVTCGSRVDPSTRCGKAEALETFRPQLRHCINTHRSASPCRRWATHSRNGVESPAKPDGRGHRR